MRLETFPVIREILRNYHHTRAMIEYIDGKIPILPRFTDADDFHYFLAKCCVSQTETEMLQKIAPKRVEVIKITDLDQFLPSTQSLLNQFHQRYH
ncbi:MAG: hypothetical protein QNJ64_18150 [Crocosphaera sp.]|nr:hypothetical protein [Crocosphaera sp.]